MKAKLEVFKGSDEAIRNLREEFADDEMDVIDRRGWRITLNGLGTTFWVAFILYVGIAHYCDFKRTMGLPTRACTCHE